MLQEAALESGEATPGPHNDLQWPWCREAWPNRSASAGATTLQRIDAFPAVVATPLRCLVKAWRSAKKTAALKVVPVSEACDAN
jgi:hypothetical protein